MTVPAVRPLCLVLLLLTLGVGAGGPPVVAADPAPAPAASAEKPAADPNDLGQGLRYCRIGDLDGPAQPGIIDAISAAKGPLVVDLRCAKAGEAAATRLGESLRRIASPKNPVFLLLGVETAAPLLAVIPVSPSILTLGATVEGLTVKIPVKIDSAHDRAACDAIAAGKPLAGLIEEKVEKRRFDEARLARAHANGGGDETPAEAADNTDKPGPVDSAAQPPPEAPVKDLVLQRAVYLHRALIALGHLVAPPAPNAE